ncbi:hypothetical protein B0T10DRAFT_170174 [Thelonectria olida]|uniref:Uncharacterized protein n=1 Tax=Thelonectria olida TaxID=1576542 RepID=A0A9P8WGD0_9HYPO|nr:hypothetical protein B0T10DRAFT_170174 [Thelonectria olida]
MSRASTATYRSIGSPPRMGSVLCLCCNEMAAVAVLRLTEFCLLHKRRTLLEVGLTPESHSRPRGPGAPASFPCFRGEASVLKNRRRMRRGVSFWSKVAGIRIRRENGPGLQRDLSGPGLGSGRYEDGEEEGNVCWYVVKRGEVRGVRPHFSWLHDGDRSTTTKLLGAELQLID